MAGRLPILLTEEELIHYHIDQYYKECSLDKYIRFEEERHIELINTINLRYLRLLKRNEEFGYENYENAFMECIDFLTKAITKRKERLEQSEKDREFLKSFQKTPGS